MSLIFMISLTILCLDRNLFKQEQIETFAQMSMVVRECVPKDALLSPSEMIELFCRVLIIFLKSFLKKFGLVLIFMLLLVHRK
jgi:hypothetical protein